MSVADVLTEILPASRVRTGPDDLATWGTDWTRSYQVAPSAIVFPQSVDEVAALTRLANERGLALVPSGGRTGLSGGAVATSGEVVVSFDRMNRILGFNEADRIVRCQAGVVTQALQQFAQDKGLFYPVDFASSGSSQIGGNIATNAGGIKVIRHGLTRDRVAGLTVVTGTGEVLELNRGLVKNATGYDLRHLFIGSEGTLGFIVEADLKLVEPPVPQRVMVLGLDRFADALRVLPCFQAPAHAVGVRVLLGIGALESARPSRASAPVGNAGGVLRLVGVRTRMPKMRLWQRSRKRWLRVGPAMA